MLTNSKSWLPSYATSLITRRRFLKGSAAGVGAAALIACGGGDGVKLEDASSAREAGAVWRATNDWTIEDETKKAVRGGVHRGWRATDMEGHYDGLVLPSSQAPHSQHTNEILMMQASRPGLDPASLEASEPAGGLAESWEFSPDGTVVTFNMRKGVKWHDIPPVSGRDMDIDDWRSTQERQLEVGTHRGFLGSILDKLEFPDDSTMVWKLKTAHAPIFEQIFIDKALGFPMQPKELNADPSLAESRAIGTGYKILDVHQPAIAMEYRKHPQYWGGDPFIDRWHLPIIPEYANQYAQFITGNLMEFTPTARDVLLLANDAPEAVIVANKVREDQATRMRWGRISPSEQIWGDPRVRVGIRRSVEWRKIAEFLSNKNEFEAAGIPVEIKTTTHLNQHPGYWLNPDKGELGDLSQNYLTGLDEAKKLFAAAGYSEPFEFPFFVLARQGAPRELDQLVMDSLERSGNYKMNIYRSTTSKEHREYRSKGLMDGLAAESGGGEYDADYFITRDYQSQGAVGGLDVPFPDPRIDRIAVAQRLELDILARYEILKEFQLVAAETMPSIPGVDLFNVFWFRWPWLRNFNQGESAIAHPAAGRQRVGAHLHWLDESMPRRERGAT